MAVPSEAIPTSKNAAAASESFQYRVRADHTSYNPGESARITVPTGGRGQFLDTAMSYLSFTIVNGSSGSDLVTSGHASSFVNAIRVYHAGSLVEAIESYGLLYNALLDVEESPSERAHGHNFLGGGNTDPATNNARDGQTISGGSTLRVSFPLVSGIVGVNVNKLVPLFAMSGGELEIEVVWANQNQPQESTAARDWSVKNVEYSATLVRVTDDSVMRSIIQSLPQQAEISAVTYSHFRTSIDNGSTSFTGLVGIRRSSVKSIIVLFRDSNEENDGTVNSITRRKNPVTAGNSGKINLRAGSQIIPQQPIDSTASAFAELLKSFHKLGTSAQATCLTRSRFETSPGTSTDGDCLFGFELESFAHNDSKLVSGLNTQNEPTYLELQANSSLTSSSNNLVADVYAMSDVTHVIDTNTGLLFVRR